MCTLCELGELDELTHIGACHLCLTRLLNCNVMTAALLTTKQREYIALMHYTMCRRAATNRSMEHFSQPHPHTTPQHWELRVLGPFCYIAKCLLQTFVWGC
jgi:hypothetical protein